MCGGPIVVTVVCIVVGLVLVVFAGPISYRKDPQGWSGPLPEEVNTATRWFTRLAGVGLVLFGVGLPLAVYQSGTC